MNATRTSGGCSAPGFTLQRTRQRVTSTSTASEEGRAVRSTKTAPAMSATGTPPDLHPQTHLCSDYSGAPLSRFFVPRRHLLFCRVILGKSFLQFSAMKMAHSPPGHHFVTGRPSVNGLALAEYVIYRGEQVRNTSSSLELYFWIKSVVWSLRNIKYFGLIKSFEEIIMNFIKGLTQKLERAKYRSLWSFV